MLARILWKKLTLAYTCLLSRDSVSTANSSQQLDYTIFINQLHIKNIEEIIGLKSKPIKVVKGQ